MEQFGCRQMPREVCSSEGAENHWLFALSGTHGVALGKSLDLEDTVSSSQHVSEGIMMNISQVWYKG